jgi:hypothetical protein
MTQCIWYTCTIFTQTTSFLAPFARATGDETWISESKRTFVRHDQTKGRAQLVKPARSANMGGILGCQGETAGAIGSESRSSHSYDENWQALITAKNAPGGKMHSRKKDKFSEYVEAKARNPQLAQK